MRLLLWLSERTVFFLALLFVLLTTGCEEDVTAILGTEKAFTLYGVLTPQADTQWVRVYPVEERLEPTRAESLNASFTSTDLTTGQVKTWQDSLIQEEDGRYSHVFWAPFRASYGHAYRLEVSGADKATTRVEANVPPETEIVVEEPRSLYDVRQLVKIQGKVPRLLKLMVVYEVKYKSGPSAQSVTEVPISYEGKASSVDGGWEIEVLLSRDYQDIREKLKARGLWQVGYGARLFGITARMMAVNKPWNPPGGKFDPEVLVQPGTMSNVNNGFGFVGAGFHLEESWLPDDEYVEKAGFRTD